MGGFIRRECKTRIVELIRRQAGEVTVDGHDPGRDIQSEHIYIGAVTGNVDYPVFAGNAMPHDDVFVIVVVCWVLSRLDSGTAAEVATATDTRCQELLNYVNAAVSQHADLMLDGETLDTAQAIIIDAMVGNVEGPEAEPVDDNGAWLAVAAVDIAVHTRMINP